jgi:hypothetical protein
LNRRQLLVGVAGVLLTSLPRSANAAEDLLKPYLGPFRHSGGDKDLKARDRAIEGVVSEMSFLVRKMARDRLTAANAIAQAIIFSRTATSLTIAMDARVFTGPLDGSKTKVTSSGDTEIDMSYVLSKDSLTQNFERDGRGRINTFTLDGDKSLRLDVRVFADELPKDLVYKLSYVRK